MMEIDSSSMQEDEEADTTSTSSYSNKKKQRGLVHVFSPFEEISRRSEPQNDDMSHTHTIQHPLQIQRSTSSEPIEQVAMLASVRQAKENFVKSKYGDHGSKDDVVFDEIVIVCAVTDQDDNACG